MATRKWIGGDTAVAQVSTVTLNNDFNDSETDLSITLTAEDGSTTQSVSIDPSGTDEATIAAALQSACAASNQSLFTAITFTVLSNVLTLTADVAGVPFYFASAVTGGAGTTTDATGTANSGPNDWNTADNWSGTTVPVDSDDVVITDSDYDILYGLDQSAIQLASLSINSSYRGAIGDAANGYSLTIDSALTRIKASGAFVRLNGDLDDVYVFQTAGGSEAVYLEGDIDNLYVQSSSVIGEVKVANSATLDNVYVLDAGRSTVTLGSSISSLDLIEADSGKLTCDSAGTTVNAGQGARVTLTDGAWTTVNIRRGGVVDYRSDGTLTNAVVFGGLLDFTNNYAGSVTVTNTTLHGGSLDIRSGLNNITFSNNPDVKGGSVVSDVGVTVNPKA